MPVRLTEEVKVSILIGDEEVHAFFPGYGSTELQDAIKKLLSGRVKQGRGARGVQDKSFEARVSFFNTTCIRVENVEDETGQSLSPDVENWRQKIPANWKVSFALHFEEKNPLSEDEEGN